MPEGLVDRSLVLAGLGGCGKQPKNFIPISHVAFDRPYADSAGHMLLIPSGMNNSGVFAPSNESKKRDIFHQKKTPIPLLIYLNSHLMAHSGR